MGGFGFGPPAGGGSVGSGPGGTGAVGGGRGGAGAQSGARADFPPPTDLPAGVGDAASYVGAGNEPSVFSAPPGGGGAGTGVVFGVTGFAPSNSQNPVVAFTAQVDRTLNAFAHEVIPGIQTAERAISTLTAQPFEFKVQPLTELTNFVRQLPNPFNNPQISNLRTQFGNPPTPTNPPLLTGQPNDVQGYLNQSGQPSDVPTVDPQNCPGCQPAQARLQARLQAQEGQLRTELRTEQMQQSDQRVTQQQKDIERFKQLETQDSSTRDIDKEIQQKTADLEQIEQELENLQFQVNQQSTSSSTSSVSRSSSSSSGGSATSGSQASPASGNVPTINANTSAPSGSGTTTEAEHQEEASQIFMQRSPTGEMPSPNQAVKFCVGCATQNDAYLFLNGEPSACSVMPS